MPGFDGTGPLGQGPMTGRGRGFCVLTKSEEKPGQTKGFAGLQGVPVFGEYAAGPYGYGASYAVPLVCRANPWFHRGFGGGRARGRSRRFWR